MHLDLVRSAYDLLRTLNIMGGRQLAVKHVLRDLCDPSFASLARARAAHAHAI